MEFDKRAFRELVEEKGVEVYSAEYNGGSPLHTGVAGVRKFAGRFWSYDDNGGFGGPYKTLQDALCEPHLCFGGVQVWIRVTGLSTAAVAGMLRLDADEGRVVEINGEEWVLGAEGQLAIQNPPMQKKVTRRKKKRA